MTDWLQRYHQQKQAEQPAPEEGQKGGPGSGNWRHTGLAGVHGGADAGGGFGKVASWTDEQFKKADYTAKSWYKDWQEGLAIHERFALKWYAGYGYSTANSYLRRTGTNMDKNAREAARASIPGVDTALEKAKLPFTTVVHRGMCSSTTSGCFQKYGNLQPGDEFTDDGYVSTSIIPEGSRQWNALQTHITVPKGSKAAYLEGISDVVGEWELLIQRGARFRVTGRQQAMGVIHLDVVLMAQGDLMPVHPWEEGVAEKQKPDPATEEQPRGDKFVWELGDITIFKKGEKRATSYGWSLEVEGVPAEASKGGPSSGHWGHAGRPGKRGGNVSGSVAVSISTGRTARERQATARTLSAWKPMGYRPYDAYIESAKENALYSINRTAIIEGISPEDVVDKIKGELDYQLKSSPISIRRTWKGASGVIEDERFKTQFETGTSGGAFNPPYRKDAEFKGLGAHNDVPIEKRPVYGYVATEVHRAGQYGPVEFVLKESVKERTTITFGDSLGRFGVGSMVGTPVRAPGIEGWDRQTFDVYEGDFTGMGYLEAQVHGGVSLADVQKIVFHRGSFYSGEMMGPYAGIYEKAQELGLMIEIDKDTD